MDRTKYIARYVTHIIFVISLTAVLWNILLQSHIGFSLTTLELPGKIQMPVNYTVTTSLLVLFIGTVLGFFWKAVSGRLFFVKNNKPLFAPPQWKKRWVTYLALALPLVFLLGWPILPELGAGVLLAGFFLWWFGIAILLLTKGNKDDCGPVAAKAKRKWIAILLALIWICGILGIFFTVYPMAMFFYQFLDMTWIMNLLPQMPQPRALEAYLTFFPQLIHFELLFCGCLICSSFF